MHPLLNVGLSAARKAGQYIANASKRLDLVKIQTKSGNDFVTNVDKTAERDIIQVIHKAYPDHAILSEETGRIDNQQSDYCWIIDPLDGTTNFIHGFPQFAVSIACQFKGKLEHAIVFDPIRCEEFTASRGKGAQLNGSRIRISNRPNLQEALLGTGFPFKPEQHHHLDAYLKTFRQFALESAGIRRAGSAALDLAYLAAGRIDGFWEIGLNEWDIAAGILLITESGGLVSDFQGGHDYLSSGNIVSANAKILKAMLKIIHPHLS